MECYIRDVTSYDEGSKRTPSNLRKDATRQRRKRNSDSEDEDYIAAEGEVVLGIVAEIKFFLRITKINLWSN